MLWWHGLVLGALQGVTEFLPVSSSGHLVLLESVLDSADSLLLFNVVVHVATLGAVLSFFWREWWQLRSNFRMWGFVFLGSIPVVVTGLGIKLWAPQVLTSLIVVIGALYLTAGINFMIHRILAGRGVSQSPRPDWSELTLSQVLQVGMFQALAILPGVSRSGATLLGGVGAGLSRGTAFSLSFLLAVPAIAGAATIELLDVVQSGYTVAQFMTLPIMVGAVAAYVVGLVSLALLRYVVAEAKFMWFGWYCLLLASIGLITQLLVRF